MTASTVSGSTPNRAACLRTIGSTAAVACFGEPGKRSGGWRGTRSAQSGASALAADRRDAGGGTGALTDGTRANRPATTIQLRTDSSARDRTTSRMPGAYGPELRNVNPGNSLIILLLLFLWLLRGPLGTFSSPRHF